MNEGVWKSFGLASTTLNHWGGKQFSFPLPKGWKIVWGKLFIATSALKSQRRVRCEFGDVGF